MSRGMEFTASEHALLLLFVTHLDRQYDIGDLKLKSHKGLVDTFEEYYFDPTLQEQER